MPWDLEDWATNPPPWQWISRLLDIGRRWRGFWRLCRNSWNKGEKKERTYTLLFTNNHDNFKRIIKKTKYAGDSLTTRSSWTTSLIWEIFLSDFGSVELIKPTYLPLPGLVWHQSDLDRPGPSVSAGRRNHNHLPGVVRVHSWEF